MRVTVNLVYGDILFLQFYAFFRTRAALWTLAVFSGLIFVYLVWSKVPESEYELWVTLALSLLSGAFGLLAGFLVSIILSMLISTNTSGVLGEHVYELTDEGFRESTQVNESLQRWSGIQSVWVGSSYLIVRINTYLFHMVPRRSFQSNEDFEAFASRATSLWRASI